MKEFNGLKGYLDHYWPQSKEKRRKEMAWGEEEEKTDDKQQGAGAKGIRHISEIKEW